MSFEQRYRLCPLCGSHILTPEWSSTFMDLALSWDRCGQCRLVFQNPRLSDATIRRLYRESSYFGGARQSAYSGYVQHDAMRVAQSHRRLDLIAKKSGVRSGRLLDVGSATGFFGVAARERGFAVTSVEPDPDMSAYGREHYGLDMRTATVEECTFELDSFDIITCWGTDSHFAHPLESFHHLIAPLKADGVFVMNYQDFDHWLRLIFPGMKKSWNVMYNFTDRSFDRLLEKLKLDVVWRGLEWQSTYLDHICRVLHLPTPKLMGPFHFTVPVVSFRVVVARRMRRP
jgi:SAM-dependent methyltransferase